MSNEVEVTEQGTVDHEELDLAPQTEADLEDAPEEGENKALISATDEGKPAAERYLAIIKGPAGEVILIRGIDIEDIKEKTKQYPAEALEEVWYGRKLEVVKQTTATFYRTKKK